MNLPHALKSGILPTTANPVDIILTAYNEGLGDLLQKQKIIHHNIMRRCKDPIKARLKFRLLCDFTETELSGMGDNKIWLSSMNVDDMIKSLYIDDPPGPQILSSLGILKSLRRRKIYHPIDDSAVTNCHKCGVCFTMFNRRHHCRACGRIFCYTCSQWNERIPQDLVSYIDTKTWIISDQHARVCQSCKDMITNYRRIEALVKYFEIIAYPLDLCIKASTLCRDWREAVRIYLSNVRDIQYCVPSTPLTDRDRFALESNMSYIQGHSKWILQALKMGLAPINGKLEISSGGYIGTKVKSCFDMMCDSNCTEILTPYDAIIILNSPIYNVEVRLLALRILETAYFSSDMALFLPIEDISVQEFVLNKPDLFLDFFWVSRINQGISSDIFRNKLLLANQDKAACVQESLQLISALEHYNDNLYELSQKLQALKTPFVGPFNIIDKFDNNIIVKNSATRPIIIQYYSDNIKKAFLYKREDIRKDAHIVALIRLMYHLCNNIFSSFKDTSFLPISTPPIDICSSHRDSGSWFVESSPMTPECGLSISPLDYRMRTSYNDVSKKVDDHQILESSDIVQENIFLATYRVTPITIDSGFIEIVPDASTLFDILNKGSISNFLYRSNSNKKVSEISSNYSASLAFWTVTTYLLGVGDRHLENIMIRNDGVLFHIDYGFVFGADTTSSFVRLDHNLIEGLGGVEMYEPFKVRCCEIYSCIRRHFNLICSCLLRLSSIQPPIKGYNFTPNFIENFITDRFLLGQTEDEAKNAFSKIIDSSRETIINRVSDVIHNTVSSFKVGGWWS